MFQNTPRKYSMDKLDPHYYQHHKNFQPNQSAKVSPKKIKTQIDHKIERIFNEHRVEF